MPIVKLNDLYAMIFFPQHIWMRRITFILNSRGKKKRLSTSDITENKQEDLDSSKNIGLGVETIGSNIM